MFAHGIFFSSYQTQDAIAVAAAVWKSPTSLEQDERMLRKDVQAGGCAEPPSVAVVVVGEESLGVNPAPAVVVVAEAPEPPAGVVGPAPDPPPHTSPAFRQAEDIPANTSAVLDACYSETPAEHSRV